MRAEFSLPHYVVDFMESIKRSGDEVYVVGGAVRNLLLQQSTDNWDFATSAKPEKIQSIFPDSFYHNNYGTVSIPVNTNGHQLIFEATPYRSETGYSDKRHPDAIQWAEKVTDDLARRDFTINAMAFDGKTIIDPFGGREDLKNKLIRAVGDPRDRFSEDALRLARAVRLAAQLGFKIESNTFEAIRESADEITNVSSERIRDEFLKILASSCPAEGVLLLRETRLLKQVLPEVDACFGVEQKSPGRHHIYDVGTHLIESLRACPSSNVITRFATLIHDVGKAQTTAREETTDIITFHNHEHVGASQAVEIATRLRLSRAEKEKLVKLVRFHMFSVTEEQTDKAVRRFIRNVGKENLDDILALRTADRLGSGARETSWRTELFKKRLEEVQQVPFVLRDLTVNGDDVMSILSLKPGPEVGKILNEIFDEVDDGKLPNQREILLEMIRKHKL